jgi:two-component system sensor histidine kinase PilS (NtrC family)
LGTVTEFHVVDDGPGVGEVHAVQVFEPFFTTESRGTGLGLYIARELAAANRALLEFVPAQERGADVVFYAGTNGANFRIRFEEYGIDAVAENVDGN